MASLFFLLYTGVVGWLLLLWPMGSRRFQRNNYVWKGLALMMAASLFMGKSSGISLIDWSRTS